MAPLLFDHVSFHYDEPVIEVFTEVSLGIDTSWRTGLIGRNGKGKTTLLRLLLGELQPTRGRITCPCRPAYFPYTPACGRLPTGEVIQESVAPFRAWEQQLRELAAHPDTAGSAAYGELQELYRHHGGYDIVARIDQEFDAMGLPAGLLQQPFDTLSGGEQTRALIVALFLRADTFPLIDEPTDHLDVAGRERLAAYLARKGGFLLVSHDRHFLDQCIDHVLSLERTMVRITHGNYSTWRQRVAVEEEREARRHTHLQREIKTLRVAARKRRTWADAKEQSKAGAHDKGYISHQAAKLMKRAVAIERRVQTGLAEKEALLRNVEKERTMKLVTERGTPAVVLTVDHATVTIGARTILRDVSLAVRHGERVAIVGPNGCGKTTLLRAIAGDLRLAHGAIRIPGFLRVARAYQHPLWDCGNLCDHIRQAGIDESKFRTILGCLGVSLDVLARPLETFSKGEQKKIDLCRSFLAPAHLLVWDEPLNYVDIISREQLERVVLDHQPTMVFVEHDQWFVERVATRVVALC